MTEPYNLNSSVQAILSAMIKMIFLGPSLGVVIIFIHCRRFFQQESILLGWLAGPSLSFWELSLQKKSKASYIYFTDKSKDVVVMLIYLAASWDPTLGPEAILSQQGSLRESIYMIFLHNFQNKFCIRENIQPLNSERKKAPKLYHFTLPQNFTTEM